MSIQRVGSADNREAWLELRKGYLTASSIYAWRGVAYADPKNAWYFEDNNREVICAEKFEGFEKEFPAYSRVSMDHGTYDEVNIANKLGAALGARVEPDNSMFVNDEWPHLAATVDGFIHTPDAELGPNFCQKPGLLAELSDTLRELDQTCLLEIKKSVSVAWSRGQVPEYYLSQLQTQLHILDMDYGVICAECIFTDPKQKWRKYWDLRPTLVKRDPTWAGVLSVCNEQFQIEKENNE